MQLKAAGVFVDQFTPVRELDYARHRIELLVSSPAIGRRLGSVEKEPFTVDWIERSIKSGDVFYDIGANVGPYSLIAAKATDNGARVYAFEPSAPSFHDLARNVLLNGCAESIVPLPLALWSESRLLSFTYHSLVPGASTHRVSSDLRLQRPLTASTIGVRLDDLVGRFGPTRADPRRDRRRRVRARGAARRHADARTPRVAAPSWRCSRTPDSTPGGRQEHTPTRRYPNPEKRRDVYWIFRRRVSQRSAA